MAVTRLATSVLLCRRSHRLHPRHHRSLKGCLDVPLHQPSCPPHGRGAGGGARDRAGAVPACGPGGLVGRDVPREPRERRQAPGWPDAQGPHVAAAHPDRGGVRRGTDQAGGTHRPGRPLPTARGPPRSAEGPRRRRPSPPDHHLPRPAPWPDATTSRPRRSSTTAVAAERATAPSTTCATSATTSPSRPCRPQRDSRIFNLD